jgi:hypothetical protein
LGGGGGAFGVEGARGADFFSEPIPPTSIAASEDDAQGHVRKSVLRGDGARSTVPGWNRSRLLPCRRCRHSSERFLSWRRSRVARVPRRIDQVRIAGSREEVVIPWASRAALVVRLRAEGDTETVRAFEAVGTSRPVKLSREAKQRLLGTCARWHDEAGERGLPEGMTDLRRALVADLSG